MYAMNVLGLKTPPALVRVFAYQINSSCAIVLCLHKNRMFHLIQSAIIRRASKSLVIT